MRKEEIVELNNRLEQLYDDSSNLWDAKEFVFTHLSLETNVVLDDHAMSVFKK